MAIRLSGMSSGLDTESIVSALVSGYQQKVTKNQQSQQKVAYKQEALKSVNSDVYKLFNVADSMRWSSAYALKTTSVSDSTKAKITASNSATNGTQTLEIKELAQAGYLTGAAVKTASGKATSSTKLKDIFTGDGSSTNAFKEGKLSLTVKGKETTINLTEDMTVQGFVNKLKDAGINANFDESYGRFFISSKETGVENDFSLTANDAGGMATLKALGLFTADNTTKAAYEQAANMDVDVEAEKLFQSKKLDAASQAQSYFKKYSAAQETINSLNDTYTSKAAAEKERDTRRDDMVKKYANYIESYDDKGEPVFNTKDMSEDELKSFQEDVDKYKEYATAVSNYEAQEEVLRANKDYVIIDPATGEVSAADDSDTTGIWNRISTETDKKNADTLASIKKDLDDKKVYAQGVMADFDSLSDANGAKRIEGRDATIELNGVEFKNSNNSFSINGLNIEATGDTNSTGPITITTSSDSQGLYDKIKDFIGQFNDVVNKINKLYNAESAKGYDPLTEEQKKEMSDTDIEKWEKKIKDSILRRDDTLSGILNTMNSSMSKVFEIDGQKLSLSTFGVSTLGLFGATKNEQYAYHIDGDADDSSTSGKADKLMAAITKDPEQVASFFQKLTNELYTTLNKKMKSTSLSSAYTIYNDKEMASEYSSYTSTITKWQDKVSEMEQRYFKQFTAMEKQMAKLQASTSNMSSMFG